jgi:hypothetical protein
MADKKSIAKLDEKLVGMRIIQKRYAADLPLVHRKMNSIIRKTGVVLSDEVFETGNGALRAWLALLFKQGASQDKLTAYLRCGLAHLTFDYVGSQYKQIGVDDLIARTLGSLKNRKLHTSFFKPPKESEKTPLSSGKTPVAKKKIEPIKRTLAFMKKGPAKKASAKGKKTGAVKSTAKKPAVKKAPAKRAMAKKPVAKKKQAAKKPSPQKPVVKKTSAKKSPAKKASLRKSIAKKPVAKKSVSRLVAGKKPVKKAPSKKPAAKKPTTKKRSVKREKFSLSSSMF